MRVADLSTMTTGLCVLALAACSKQKLEDAPAVSAAECPRGETATVTITDVNQKSMAGQGTEAPAGYVPESAEPPKVETTVTLAAEKNLNLEWLERVIRCEKLAYEQGLLPRDDQDPLSVDGVDVDVRQGDASYVVDIVAADVKTAKEVRRRSIALMQEPERTWQIGWP